MTSTTSHQHAYAALALRLGLGGMYLAHGLIKLVVFTPAGTAGFFESLGYPGYLGYLVMIAEIGGGAFILAGVWTRWVSLALIPVLLGALNVHFASGFLFSAQGGGWEYPAFLAVASVALALLGDGAYALGALKKSGVAQSTPSLDAAG